ncbi:MAG: indole-3-glycerol phosphate synthase TrpC [Firmicutes bacterium]|nr:indole-3-glycerol phosphate synthase TrpC [Bacillota bacterium]
MSILDQLARYAKERVLRDKESIGPEQMKALAAEAPPAGGKAFYDAMAGPEMGFICEVKKASPSKGVIDPQFDYLQIAREYEAAGADGISCLTEPKWFLGSDAVFQDIRACVNTPMLRKDFVVDEYQLYQAKCMGADCVLLICALLDTKTIENHLAVCDALGLAALVETHDEAEIVSALSAGARMIGVNNRNLKDFSVDLDNASRLRERIPGDRLYVAESGVSTPGDAARLKTAGADAILVGEAMMRAADKKAFLQALREAAR